MLLADMPLPDPTFELEATSGEASGHAKKARKLYGEGRREEALEEFRVALALESDNPSILNNHALVLAGLGRYPEAMKELGRSLEIRPRFADTFFKLAIISARLGNDTGAIDDLKKVLDLAPAHDKARGVYAALLARNDRLEEALRVLDGLSDEARRDARELRKAVGEALLRRLVSRGIASWAGGKPEGSRAPIKLAPGPTMSDLIVEERQQLRGSDRD